MRVLVRLRRLWMGGDSARSVPLGDGRILWLFADTWWPWPGSNERNGAIITSDSIAIQTGYDLTTATITFHRATTPSSKWFYISATHFAWPMDAVVIGNDLYVTSVRVLQSNPLGGEYGWAIHKVANALTLPVASWVSTLLYQSGDTGTRPVFSPYIGNDGYVYGFAIKRFSGWLWCRWTLANFTGTGTQGNVEYATGFTWSTVESQALVIAANPDTAEGSVHRRSDGRWVITDSTGVFPLLSGQVRLSATTVPTDFSVIATYDNPRHANPELLPPDYWTYAYKAHPWMPGGGLVVSYVDNAAGAPDLSIYWPKFQRLSV